MTGSERPASFRWEPQPAAFVTIASTPAASNAAAVLRASSSPSSRLPACSARAPQQPPYGVTVSKPYAARTRAEARFTSPKSTLWTQPVSRPTRPIRSPAGRCLARRRDRLPPRRRQSQRARNGPGAGSLRERERHAHDRAGAAGRRTPQPEDALAERPPHLLLDALARQLDQPVVLHAGRARGEAGHAAETAVEVLGDRCG